LIQILFDMMNLAQTMDIVYNKLINAFVIDGIMAINANMKCLYAMN